MTLEGMSLEGIIEREEHFEGIIEGIAKRNNKGVASVQRCANTLIAAGLERRAIIHMLEQLCDNKFYKIEQICSIVCDTLVLDAKNCDLEKDN